MIPDGNRRYAAAHGISASAAYLLGAAKGIELVGWCIEQRISHLSVFGVSTDKLRIRPRP